MGDIVTSLRLQGRCQALSNLTPLVASVVPDVSGIDKIFDYVVPDTLVSRVSVGCKVRVVLHGRRVAAWVVSLVRTSEREEGSLPVEKLSPIVSVSGMGVESHLVPLTHWIAQQWWGTWRATLASASAPRVTEKSVHPRHGKVPDVGHDPVTIAVNTLVQQGSGLLIVPPAVSALTAVVALAARGSVLVVCPTQRMAVLGAAALRRRGLTVALAPDDWENARAGVDVVIGARSGVLAPCANAKSIVVVDEHDELLQEERAPTWDASSVAMERAAREGIPCVLTSSIPSLRALHQCAANTHVVDAPHGWPQISVVDLAEVPVNASLLSSELLRASQQKDKTTVCILNTKGKSRLVVCKACKAVQKCSECLSLLEQDESGIFTCRRCDQPRGSVCVECGRSSFVVPRGGVSQLRSQLESSISTPVIEITADTADDWAKGSLFIGTEAVLYRMSSADTVVFADIDRDLGAPRVSGSFEALALIAKAARMVSPQGEVIIQTRQPHHPLLTALSSSDVSRAVHTWTMEQLRLFQQLSLPPFSTVARIILAEERSLDELPEIPSLSIAREPKGAILRASSHELMREALEVVRHTFGADVRVHASPRRY